MTGVQTCALPICFPVTIWKFMCDPEKSCMEWKSEESDMGEGETEEAGEE